MKWWITGLATAAILAGCGGSSGSSSGDTIAPVITSDGYVYADEHDDSVFFTVTTDDPTALLTLGGVDKDFFVLDANGSLRFTDDTVEYDSNQDSNHDNVFELLLTASDAAGNMAQQELLVILQEVAAIDTTAPRMISEAAIAMLENDTFVVNVIADEPSTFTLSGGPDKDLFKVYVNGELDFKAAPNYEAPADADGNNLYEFQLTLKDDANNTRTYDMNVTVGDVDETRRLVLKTGQTKSYDVNGDEVINNPLSPTLPDDGYYQKGVARDYTARPDGTVFDDSLGLMWQDSADTNTTKRKWTTDANFIAGEYDNTASDANNSADDTATEYCDQLTLGGFYDWRLPTIEELLSLTNKGIGGATAIDSEFVHTATGTYWTATTSQKTDGSAWFVDFSNGTGDWMAKNSEAYVRCVRFNR